MAMKTINFEQAKKLGWRWFDIKERTKQLERYAALQREWSALDILRLPSEEVTDRDKLRAVLCEELIDEKILHTLACDFAERALSKVEKPCPESVKAIEVKRRWIRGDATDEELSAAASATRPAAASGATRFVACYAAEPAARSAARLVAWVAAMTVAGSAAWHAERSAETSAATYAAASAAASAAADAAWYAEHSWQVAHIIEVLEGND